MKLVTVFFNSLFVFCLFVPVFAQVSNKENPNCNPNYAKLLVERQISESQSLEDAEKRIKILVRSADFLWEIDNENARKYFAEAFATAEKLYQEKGYQSKNKDGLITILPDSRFDVISSIAKKDSEWAKKLYEKALKEYEENAEKDKRDAFNKDREIGELLDIAVGNAKSNPALTLQIARRLLRNKLIHNWYFTLYQIAEVNQPLADQIYEELLANYAGSEVYRLLYLSAYAFGNERIFGIEKYSLGVSKPSNFIAHRRFQTMFLNALFRKILTLTPESISKSPQSNFPETAVALAALRDLEPVVGSGFPELSEAFQRSKAFAGSLVSNEILDSIDRQEKQQTEFRMGFDERLERLAKLDEEGKLSDIDIVNLVISIKTEEQYKTADFWVLKINDSKVREDTYSLFHFNRAQLAVKENRLEDAAKYADKVPELEQRATLYFRIAEKELKTNKNSSQTLDVLGKVYKLAEKAEDSVGKAQVFFGLAFMYAKIDFLRADDCLTNAIRVTNKLENPDIFKNSVTRQVKGKNHSFFASYSTVGFNMEEVFKTLAEKDFSSALGQAESFTDKYFRTLAVIASVKDCIEPKKQTKPKKKN